jgi:hypothetical protein
MYKQLSLVAIFVVLLTAVGLTPQVQAARLEFMSPVNPGANVYRYQGEAATAFFSATTDGCIYTDAYLFAGENSAKAGPGAPNKSKSAQISIYRYDVCNGIWLSSAYGTTTLDGASFQIDGQLNSAHLQTTINLIDGNSGTGSVLAVDLTWTGQGELNRSKSQYQYESAGCKVKGRFNGDYRAASVIGGISDGTTNYAANGARYADLQSMKNAEMNIGCGW